MRVCSTLCLLVFLATLCLGEETEAAKSGGKTRAFPKDFKIGTTSMAYQIEGDWDSEYKGYSIWDVFVHQDQSPIADNSTGDDACKSFQYFDRDIQMLKYLGVNFYKFSISWPRLLPTDGFPDTTPKWKNSTGLKYYNDLIDHLIEAGIEPYVVMYGWDLPQALQGFGGWTNPNIAEWFEEYAKVLFDNFGDRVKTWFTIEAPNRIAVEGYGNSTIAPGLGAHGTGDYMAIRNLLRAHAKVWHLYDKKYRATQKGTVSIVLNSNHAEGATKSKEDAAAAIDSMKFDIGMYAHPIFSKEGGFPERVIELVAKKSKALGYAKSRLTQLTEKEIAFIKGTSDYYGLNYLFTKIWSKSEYSSEKTYEAPAVYDDLGAVNTRLEYELEGKGNPTGIRKSLTWIKEQYNNPNILVTMNTYLASNKDSDKILYYQKYLGSILDAIEEEKINIKGYTIYSLMDQFMWEKGYQMKTGLFEVDFKDEKRTRKAKSTAEWWKYQISKKALDAAFQAKASGKKF